MTSEQEKLVQALYRDLKKSYPSLTLEWLTKEAEKQIAGQPPTGGPGMFLNEPLKKAGYIS